MRKIDVLLIFVLIVEFLFASYCGLIWFKGIASDVVNDTNVEMKGSCKYTSDYVNTSEIVAKRSEQSNLMNEYINKFRVYVNSGRYNFYDVNTLYLIPVGINKCISAGNSKFGLEWEYFFIGVIYTGVNYSYFAISLDDAGCGIDFVDSSTLRADSDGKLLVSKEDLSVDLTDLYNDTKKNMRYVSEEHANEAKKPYHLFSEVDGLEKLAEISNRRYIEVISSCHYNTEFY